MDELTIGPASGLPGEPVQELGPQPVPYWAPWTAPAALIAGIGMALVAGVLIDIPAGLLGVKVTGNNLPGGLVLADTIVQDCAFVLAAVLFARRGGQVVRAWMFGLRPPRMNWWRVAARIALLFGAVLVFAAIWAGIFHPAKDTELDKLGADEGTLLLALSALLTCVVAPIAEEFLFRGYFFTAVRNWRGTWPAAVITGLVFGGVHVGSAPLADLAPLAALGFGLCLLYRATGSLYPCIVAHSLNNCVAFGSLEGWNFGQVALLALAALAAFWAIAQSLIAVGVITPERPVIGPRT